MAKTNSSSRSKSTGSTKKPASTRRTMARPAKKTTRTSARTTRTRSKTTKSKQIPSFSLGQVSPERKLDIIGVFLALIGLLTFLSLISAERSQLTGWWVNALRWAVGWGTYALPLVLIAAGLWLVFRNIDQLPRLSPERITGIFLLLGNILTWLHLAAGGGWDLALAGQGGGHIGGMFERALVLGIGKLGTVIALLGWLLIAAALTLDKSIPELIRHLKPLLSTIQNLFEKKRQQQEQEPDEAFGKMPHPVEQITPEEHAPLQEVSVHPAQEETQKEPAAAASKTKNETAQTRRSDSASETQPHIPHTTITASAKNWKLPAVGDILDPATPVMIQENVDHDRARLIEDTLASFGAPGHVVSIQRGPTITQYGIEPDYIESRNGRTRVRVSKIANLADDLALALAATRIRIQAPVPGHSYLGIEVPNAEISQVSLLEVIESKSFKKLRSPLRLSLGKDVAGKPVAVDLANMPHLLIAGTTGSGKSVCINSVLCSFLMNNSPADLRLVLVDPKRVELTGYNGIPHLLAPVIVETDRVIGALQWMLREMDGRYHKFAKLGVRNITEYNRRQSQEHLPYIVVVIDELADLMMLAPDETERAITRLAQLARATGIHLILATQRPSVNVVTGLIKANFPARVAFAVASGIDSRVILDQPGAERLLGRGDMLFQAPDAAAPVRLQGVFVSEGEIQRLVDYWKIVAAEAFQNVMSSGAEGPIDMPLPPGVPLTQAALFEEMEPEEKGDPLLDEAIELVRREGRASITMLQRRMRIGYTRAARIIDHLEEKGIISPTLPHTQVREVLDYGDMAPPVEE